MKLFPFSCVFFSGRFGCLASYKQKCNSPWIHTLSQFVSSDKSRLAALGETGRIRQSSPPPKPKAISLDRTEVFAAVLFTEFLKELAAIAQEHSILSYIPVEE